jgi:hypothetical protein
MQMKLAKLAGLFPEISTKIKSFGVTLRAIQIEREQVPRTLLAGKISWSCR